MSDVFHSGQLVVQRITGEEEIAKARIPMIRSSLHPRSVSFIEHQNLAFIGSEDRNGDIWLSLLVGKRGFVFVPSLDVIKFDLSLITSSKDDVFFKNIMTKPTVGILFHEAVRRARYRAWGLARQEEDHLCFDIRKGYPSCPKHIQRQVIEVADDSVMLSPQYLNGVELGQTEREWIINAHTFFIATQTGKGDIDASHRGGDPGFIEILENGQLRVPDYIGNSMFSTLGNIYDNPRAALLFVDYNRGETLQLSGIAELQFDQNSIEDLYKSGGTGRFWTFQTNKWIRTLDHHKVSTKFIDSSPFNVLTEK